MRNLVNSKLTEDTTSVERITPRQRPLSEREFNRRVRESGRRETALNLRVARAMKGSQA